MFKPIPGGSKIIVGEGFQCWLPPIPDKSQIINSGLPREEQYWRRQPIPEFYKERIVEEEYKKAHDLELVLRGDKKKVTYCDPLLERYRRREWHRRIYGVWFYNDGVPTYLTGSHYFYLNWSKFDHKENDGYPFYYEFSRDNFYIRSWCEQNPKSLGYIFIASRGSGKTSEEISTIINRATMYHNHRAALQSNDFELGAKGVLIQAKTVPLFNALPKFFKPEYAHGTNAQLELVFRRRSIRGEKSVTLEFGPDQELMSTIFAVPPGEKVLDKETLGDLLEDEVGKVDPKKVADVYVRHETNLKTVFRNHRKIGLIRKTTTVEEMDCGGDECYKIWKDSDSKIIDGNGYTTSKIHRHLISALDTDTTLDDYIDSAKKNWGAPCDKFGRIDKQISGLKIKNDREAVKHDLKKLSSRMRKSPINETEAFIKDQSKSIFNIQILSNRLNQIRNEMTNPPYTKGNLYWLKEKFGPVGFAPDDHAGRFNWAWFPDEFTGSKNPDNWKILNNVGREYGYNKRGKAVHFHVPKNVNQIKIATDPIQFSRTVDPRASKSSIHGFRMYDSNVDYGKEKKNWTSHNFIFEYVNRPEDPEIYCEDLAMACFFLGAKVLPERNIKTINTYFEQNNLDRFLAYPNDFVDGIGLDVQGDSTDAGFSSTTEVINEYTSKLITFINEHGHRMPFDVTIEDWLNFDPNKVTKHDPTVSSGFALIHAWKIHKEEVVLESNIGDYFDMVDNSGLVGTLIETEND